ncbi:MAG TPA: YceI family protein [Rhodanobacteraceae bacterium]|nr:YceI family protein [Rhodanobacteraceae bacterium]
MPGHARRVACALAATLLLGTMVAPVRADRVAIAPASYAAFSVRLFWLKHIRGHFEKLYGDLDWSPDRHQGVVHAWINVTTARMRNMRYRRMLLGPGFLDAATYPRIQFVSAPVDRRLLHLGGDLHGKLSMHGVTQPVTFTLQPSSCMDPETMACTLRLHGSVQRSRFGIRQHSTILSDSVQLDLVIVLTPRKADTARR